MKNFHILAHAEMALSFACDCVNKYNTNMDNLRNGLIIIYLCRDITVQCSLKLNPTPISIRKTSISNENGYPIQLFSPDVDQSMVRVRIRIQHLARATVIWDDSLHIAL